MTTTFTFPENVLAHAPWSISKSNVLDICPKQYMFKYMAKEKEAKTSSQSKVGTVLHSVLEHSLLDSAQVIDVLFNKLADDAALTLDERLACEAKLGAIQDFRERMDRLRSGVGVKKELLEHRLAIRPDFSPTTFFDKKGLLRGVIDQAILTKDDVLIIIDHKSGKKKPIEEHATQFYSYMLMSVAHFPVRAVQCAINYIGTDKLDWAKHPDGTTKPWTRDEINQIVRPWLTNYLSRLTYKLAELESGVHCTSTGWQCDYCGYVDRCVEGQAEVIKRRAKKGLPAVDTNL